MAFPESDTDKFYVGAEDFNIYQCCLQQDASLKTHVMKAFRGHNAPVTSVHVHPGVSQNEKYPEMTELLITSSMDWTVKLWSPKDRNTAIHTFEAS
jgi:WD40 repeat protein